MATHPPEEEGVIAPNALAITMVVMLATFMQVLDSTIANVALPHMQASLGAATDTITWVLTSYIAASAIATPLTGWLADKFGRRKLFIAAISGFVITSMMCGMAQSLNQMVAFRMMQGASGAFLVPLGQAFLLDAYPRSLHGKAMAWWGVGVMVGPVMGPLLGGWLTDNFDWRWVFYVNLPVGGLTLLGALMFLRETPTAHRRFDMFGFVSLSIGLLAFQVMLDRGQQIDWFDSWEVRIEAMLAAAAFWVFGVHTFAKGDGILNMALIRDRNCATGFVFIFIVGMMMVATTALLPPMLQGLFGYPVLTTGMVLAPRGLGTMFGMMLMGQIVGKVDPRFLLLCGLTMTGASMYWMSQFSPQMDMQPVIYSGLLQGFGLGFMFVPLNTIAFATLAPQFRTDAASFYSLLRNIGGSIGVSIVIGTLARQVQVAHADIGSALTPFSVPFAEGNMAQALGPTGDTAMAMLNAAVTAQAAMVGYIDVFRMLMWLTVAVLPLMLFLRPPARIQQADDEAAHMVMD